MGVIPDEDNKLLKTNFYTSLEEENRLVGRAMGNKGK